MAQGRGRVQDPARLAAVRATGLLDTPADPAFDQLAELAAELLDAPFAFVTLVDDARSFWKSAVGVDSGERQNPVEESFCQYVVASGEGLVVGDVRAEPLTRDNPSIASMGVAAWAGFPVTGDHGETLGSFCVVDTRVRTWSARDIEVLRRLAACATTEVRLRTAVRQERAARLDAEAGATALGRLQAATVALFDATSYAEITATVIDRAERLLGAAGGAIGHVDAAGTGLVVAAVHGAAHLTLGEVVPLAADRPLPVAARTGQPQWADTRAARDAWPGLDALLPPDAGLVALPLLSGDGARGVLGLVFSPLRALSTADRVVALALAQESARALERGRLLAAIARRERHAQFLARASRRLSSSLDVEDTADAFARLALEELAAWCLLHLVQDGGAILAVAARHVDPTRQAGLEALAAAFEVRLDQPHGAGAAIRSGRPQVFPDIPDEVLRALSDDPAQLAAMRELAGGSALVVPLLARGRRIGAATVGSRRGRSLGAEELELLEELTSRAAVALDNAARYRRERDVAVALQHTLLPGGPPEVAGLDLATRYVPGTVGVDVGGDWYDAITFPDGRVGLVVGDVMGHGLAAAALMGQLRVAVRAYALDGHGPAAVLARTARLLASIDDAQLATCVYGVYDPATRVLCIASAGHVPPLLLHPDGSADLLPLEPGLPLGVGEAAYTQAELTLPPGAGLLLYTDGLVEGRGRSLADGLAGLCDVAAAPDGLHDAERLCSRVLAQVPETQHDDDIALLALTLPREPLDAVGDDDSERHARLEIGPEAAAVGAAREFTTAVLHSWQSPHDHDTAVLVVSELLTNAVRHARTTMTLTLTMRGTTLRIGVADGVAALPRVEHPPPDQLERGRGLWLVEALADDWGSDPRPSGKQVWADLRSLAG